MKTLRGNWLLLLFIAVFLIYLFLTFNVLCNAGLQRKRDAYPVNLSIN